MDYILTVLIVLIPVMVIELGLMIAALVHILQHNTYKTGNRLVWVLVSVLVGIIGPVLYFIIGKADE